MNSVYTGIGLYRVGSDTLTAFLDEQVVQSLSKKALNGGATFGREDTELGTYFGRKVTSNELSTTAASRRALSRRSLMGQARCRQHLTTSFCAIQHRLERVLLHHFARV